MDKDLKPSRKTTYHLMKTHLMNDRVKRSSTASILNRQKSRLQFMGIEQEAPEVRLDMYFDKETKDFRLMMNLLSERPGTEGLTQSFRLLTIFDKHFKRLWVPNDFRILDQDLSAPKQMQVSIIYT